MITAFVSLFCVLWDRLRSRDLIPLSDRNQTFLSESSISFLLWYHKEKRERKDRRCGASAVFFVERTDILLEILAKCAIIMSAE